MEKRRPPLTNQSTSKRQPITTEEYLSVTLRFLATGESFASLGYQFRISRSTLSQMIPFVCKVIYNVLKPDVLKCPSTEAEWLQVAQDFAEKWQFPNCIGAGDGKHIRLLCPQNSGSLYYNYKGYYSRDKCTLADTAFKENRG